MPEPRCRAVLFDLDGTLIDSLDDLTEATNRTREGFGLGPLDKDGVRVRIGQGARRLVERTVPPEAPLDEALERFYGHYMSVLTQRTRPYPGMLELLEGLGERGIIRGVATNKPSAFTNPIIEALGLAARLEGWASADEAERKPSPAVLQLALKRAGAEDIPPREVTYVGDMLVDVAAAHRFGARSVAVTYGFEPDGLGEARPDALAGTVAELSEVLGVKRRSV